MNKSILLSWIGGTDLRAAQDNNTQNPGPLGSALIHGSFHAATLLCNYPESDSRRYIEWISSLCPTELTVEQVTLSSPTDYNAIYENVDRLLEPIFKKKDNSISFHLSPGTPAMIAVWIILGKTKYPATLIQTSIQQGLQTVTLPFDLAADYKAPLNFTNPQIAALLDGLPQASPAWNDIIHSCDSMKLVIARARRLAQYDYPILIEGENGTGKELLARAIYNQSERKKNGPLKVINCGAIPRELIDSTFFGHTKGSFTGAVGDQKGIFEVADGGTVFLDEIGELPLDAQVRLLRTLQEQVIQRVGTTDSIAIDVQIIAATNRDLALDVANNLFREDLYHRLAVGTLRLPALRERGDDLRVLTKQLLAQINEECRGGEHQQDKIISHNAINIILGNDWPGNVRELKNTLIRAYIWTVSDTIEESDMQSAIHHMPSAEKHRENVLNRSLDKGLDIDSLLKEVQAHYIERALQSTGGKKKAAAALLGIKSYQTLDTRMKKLGLEHLAR